jgi:hypothetical protein
MNNEPSEPPHFEQLDTQELEVTQQTFLLARAQLAASRTEPQPAPANWPSPQR